MVTEVRFSLLHYTNALLSVIIRAAENDFLQQLCRSNSCLKEKCGLSFYKSVKLVYVGDVDRIDYKHSKLEPRRTFYVWF